MIIYNKGYQEFSGLQSNVISKVKGIAIGNVTQENASENFNMTLVKYYNRIWDHLDIVQPPIVSYFSCNQLKCDKNCYFCSALKKGK